jgi:hypothetical protein
MVTALAPAPVQHTLRLPLSPATPSAPVRRPAARTRPIPVAAYPAGVPRWVTFGGRRQRVVAVHQQPALALHLDPLPFGAVRMAVELADGRVLTLIHDRGAWYE